MTGKAAVYAVPLKRNRKEHFFLPIMYEAAGVPHGLIMRLAEIVRVEGRIDCFFGDTRKKTETLRKVSSHSEIVNFLIYLLKQICYNTKRNHYNTERFGDYVQDFEKERSEFHSDPDGD